MSFPGKNFIPSLSTVRAQTEAKVAEAQRSRRHLLSATGWPSASTVVRVILGLVVAIVLIGWLLSALSQ